MLYQTQVTTLLSVALVIIRLGACSCAALLAYNITFILLETFGITLVEITRLLKYCVSVMLNLRIRSPLFLGKDLSLWRYFKFSETMLEGRIMNITVLHFSVKLKWIDATSNKQPKHITMFNIYMTTIQPFAYEQEGRYRYPMAKHGIPLLLSYLHLIFLRARSLFLSSLLY